MAGFGGTCHWECPYKGLESGGSADVCAEAGGDAAPGVTVGSGAGEVEDEAPYRALDLGPEFEEEVAEGGNLSAGEPGAPGVEPDRPEEDMGGGGEQHPELQYGGGRCIRRGVRAATQ